MKAKSIVATLFATLALAACGGGGSGSSTAPTTPTASTCTNGGTNYPTCTPPVVQGTQWEVPVTSVPATDYAAGSNNLGLFTRLNQLRQAVGVGLLAENTQLQAAAGNHSAYLVANNWTLASTANIHAETSTLTGFTGATPVDRITAAGYTFSTVNIQGANEDASFGSIAILANGSDCIQSLVEDTYYHRVSLLGSYVDVGVSYFISNAASDAGCVIDLGIPPALGGVNGWNGQIPATPVFYPYNGETGVGTTFYPSTETPNPAPDLGASAVGVPITVSLEAQSLLGGELAGFAASDVTITAFTVTAQGGSTPVNARLIAEPGVLAGPGVELATDPHVGYVNYANVCLLPLAPLAINTTYNVVFTATVKGQAVNLSWSFSTGAGNQ